MSAQTKPNFQAPSWVLRKLQEHIQVNDEIERLLGLSNQVGNRALLHAAVTEIENLRAALRPLAEIARLTEHKDAMWAFWVSEKLNDQVVLRVHDARVARDVLMGTLTMDNDTRACWLRGE